MGLGYGAGAGGFLIICFAILVLFIVIAIWLSWNNWYKKQKNRPYKVNAVLKIGLSDLNMKKSKSGIEALETLGRWTGQKLIVQFFPAVFLINPLNKKVSAVRLANNQLDQVREALLQAKQRTSEL